MLVDFCVGLVLSAFIFIYEPAEEKERHLMMFIIYLIVTALCTYIAMTVVPLLLHRETWTRWKFFLCAYVDIIIITLAYLLVEQYSLQHYGIRFHLFMNEEHTFMQNYLSMFTFDCIAGTVVCVVVYFFIISNEVNVLLREKETSSDHILSQKSWPKAQAPDEMITLSGSTKDSLMLKPSHILYMEVLGNYVDIHYLNENGKVSRKTIRTTIQQMEEALGNYPAVIRCHRTYIVNVSHVEKANASQQGLLLILKYVSKEIPVSRTYKKNFRSFMEFNRFFSVFASETV
ncbi:MAG: LytTR family transcriptional regulator [Tannerella sp.]|jgi:hypothetical protein|nr:LytTR family transcriptional regulator [Tannerella sp.]